MSEVNKYGVPHKVYELLLEDGTSLCVDIGCEEDWGDIQQAFDAEGNEFVGWGNDVDGHTRITAVAEIGAGDALDVAEWAGFVWGFAGNYAGEGDPCAGFEGKERCECEGSYWCDSAGECVTDPTQCKEVR